jgi:hypothetical protein
MFTKELSGVDIGAGKSPEKKEQNPKAKAKLEARLTAQFKEWEVEVKRRGCV